MHITNKQAFHNYQILDKLEAGIHLQGAEVKSIRGGRMSLTGSFVKIVGSEMYLVNSEIPLYEYAQPVGYDPSRTRKLLLHRKQILALKSKLDQGNYTIVPLSVYTSGGLIKVEIALVRGKKQYEKRETIKKKDLQRELERSFRGKVKY